VYIGFYYIGSFGRDVLDMSQSTSINLLLVLNGVGLVARVLPNFVAEKLTGPVNLMLPYVLASGIILYCWVVVESETGLWVFAVIYGIAASGIHALFPVVLTSLTDDQKKLGVRSGMGFSIVGCAVLTGPPIAGALVQRANGSYVGLQVFSGSTMMIAVLFGVAARWAKVGWKVKVKI
jgi:MFS-type transporter involved in bile tolerance (Atg22 family)